MSRLSSHRIPYVAAFDGVRGVAIIAVFIFHVWPKALPGGFSAVDVFFSLSGFLITSIALRGLGLGRFSLKEFYLRRIQRLLPNAITTIAGVFVLWMIFFPALEVAQPAYHGLWTLFNLSNFYAWHYLGGYWGMDALWAPFTHFWSLGVEEQFYLLFPGLFVLLVRFQPARYRVWLIGLAWVSFVGCVVCTRFAQAAAFYLLPTRAWELLLGAILATFPPAGRAGVPESGVVQPTPWVEAAGGIGLAAIAAALIFFRETPAFPGLLAMVPTGGTMLIMYSVTRGGRFAARVLSRPWLVAIGRGSYSLYLWHWPMIIFGRLQAERHHLPDVVGAVAGGLASFGLSAAAYFLIERPLRESASDRWRRVAGIGVAFALTAALGGALVWRASKVTRDRRWDQAVFDGELYNADRSQHLHREFSARGALVYFPPAPNRRDDLWHAGGIQHLYGAAQPQVVVMGSSHAMMYAHQIDEECRRLKLSVAFFCSDAAPAMFGETWDGVAEVRTRAYDEARRKFLRQWHPEAVIVADRWDFRAASGGPFDARLRAFLQEVSPWVGRVLFVAEIPTANRASATNLWTILSSDASPGAELPTIWPDRGDPVRQRIAANATMLSGEFSQLRVLRLDRPFYNADGSIRYAAGRKFFYIDNLHLSEAGAEQARPVLAAALAEAHAAATRAAEGSGSNERTRIDKPVPAPTP